MDLVNAENKRVIEMYKGGGISLGDANRIYKYR